MNLQKLNPWNWFKHEDQAGDYSAQIPIKRDAANDPLSYQTANPITHLQQEIDRLFDQALQGFGIPSLGRSSLVNHSWPGSSWIRQQAFRPSVNISSDGKKYWIAVEAPGMKESDISLDLNKDTLTIRGEKREEKEEKGYHYYRMERHYGSFQRTLSLPEDSDLDKIEAKLEHGVLTISIPRRELPAGDAKRIPIRS